MLIEIKGPQDPRLVRFYFSTGDLYLRLSMYSQALKYAKKGLDQAESSRDLAYAYSGLANIRFFMGDYQTSLDYYTQAINLGSENKVTARINRGIVYTKLGAYDEAL